MVFDLSLLKQCVWYLAMYTFNTPTPFLLFYCTPALSSTCTTLSLYCTYTVLRLSLCCTYIVPVLYLQCTFTIHVVYSAHSSYSLNFYFTVFTRPDPVLRTDYELLLILFIFYSVGTKFIMSSLDLPLGRQPSKTSVNSPLISMGSETTHMVGNSI